MITRDKTPDRGIVAVWGGKTILAFAIPVNCDSAPGPESHFFHFGMPSSWPCVSIPPPFSFRPFSPLLGPPNERDPKRRTFGRAKENGRQALHDSWLLIAETWETG